MEVIEVSGYTEEEKLNIAEKYLVPKQIKENGLSREQYLVHRDRDSVRLINYYTRESGVRNLEREIGNLCRKVAKSYRLRRHEKGQHVRKESAGAAGQEESSDFDIIKGRNGSGRDDRSGLDGSWRRYTFH